MESQSSNVGHQSKLTTSNDLASNQGIPNFKEHSYRIVVCLLFGFISFINGMCWVVVSPISKQVGTAYNQSSAVVALIPMSYLICYVFLNFPSNWVLDVKGIKKGIITGSVLTCIGTGIRCLVNYSFSYMIIGQFFCAMAQPFIMNAPTKLATRWFTPQNRSLALALLTVVNIVGTAVGFIIPTIFVETQNTSHIQDQFWTLMLFQFCLTAVATILNLFFFVQRPPNLPSLSAMVEHTEFMASIKVLFTSKKFLSLMFAFATINGAFNIYGSLLEQILIPYGITADQTSILAASMMITGIVSAAIIGMYVQRTLNYKKVFTVLSILGIIQTVSFAILLKMQAQFFVYLIAIILQGMLFIPTMPLCFDYGCDILFPVGEAQITGALMTMGQIFGIFFILISQQVFGLGQDSADPKTASLLTVIFVGAFLLVGCGAFCFFNSQLKRSKLQKLSKNSNQRVNPQSLISERDS